ncbi:MAG TPA: lipopolysaccharide heptosyltransferase II [Acidobacteriota bacterium]|jgi:heptosyltransferase-2
MNSFLIRVPNWIGDCIISLPAVAEVRRIHPRAEITVAARSWVADIYRVGGLVDDVIEYQSGARGPARLFRFAAELRRRKFSCALLLQNAMEAALLVRLAGIPRRIGYATDRRGFLLTDAVSVDPAVGRMHQSFYYLDLLTRSGLSNLDYARLAGYRPDARIRLSTEQHGMADAFLSSIGVSPERPLAGINPGAFFGSAKRWFPERYAAVADYLAERHNMQVLIFGSSNEIEIARRIEQNMKTRPFVLSGKTTLMELISLINRCDLFITNDSGPMHLASALDRPMIALFGSTDETATGPLSGRSRVIHKPVECTPCFLRECPIDLRCFKQIEVAEVCQIADEMSPHWKARGVRPEALR